MVAPKTEEAIELLRINGELTSRALAEVGKAVAPGVSTKELNRVAETFIRDNGAVPNFLDYDGYPYSICTSVNDVVVHGFPSDYILKDGDIVEDGRVDNDAQDGVVGGRGDGAGEGGEVGVEYRRFGLVEGEDERGVELVVEEGVDRHGEVDLGRVELLVAGRSTRIEN